MSGGTPATKAIAERHEKSLWRRLKAEGDQSAREELVAIYLPMARRMAGRYAGVVEPYDDLVQVASLGLLNAIDRYDLGRETPFVGYAKPTILGELKRYFRDKVWSIRIPRVLHDRIIAIESISAQLTEELSRPPSPAEIAARSGLDVADVLETLAADANRRALAFEAEIRGQDGESPSTPEWMGRLDEGYELIEDRLTMETVLPSLNEREREVLRLRFVEDLPQSTIARRVGCSQMHVSRLLRATLARLRREAEGMRAV